ncbi:MAG: hypothetical protein KatS3mg017_0232 [Fimbriimonadales bacterium]|nr:MAG: hypothetical protein KatS3mg017_0232 [Fimbriimonadales bacterium]
MEQLQHALVAQSRRRERRGQLKTVTHELIRRGKGPYFYLPKLESHLEARLWNNVFLYAQERRGVPRGTIHATVLIENILAAFECKVGTPLVIYRFITGQAVYTTSINGHLGWD